MSQKSRRYTDQKQIADRRMSDVIALQVCQKDILRRCEDKEGKIEQLQIIVAGVNMQIKDLQHDVQQMQRELKKLELNVASGKQLSSAAPVAIAKGMPNVKTIASSIGLIIVTIAGAIQALKEYLTQ